MARYCGCPTKDNCYGGTADGKLICKFQALLEGRLQEWSQKLSLVVDNTRAKEEDSK